MDRAPAWIMKREPRICLTPNFDGKIDADQSACRVRMGLIPAWQRLAGTGAECVAAQHAKALAAA